MRPLMCALFIVAVAALLSGCLLVSPPPATEPIATIEIDRTDANEALIVLLPGMGDRAATFIDTGFTEASAGAGYDLAVVDAHFGYYTERTLVQRLHQDVITPARNRGYSQIWLLGISLGGLGSALYTSEFPGNVNGVVLLAPFLGDDCLVDEIAAAGGLSVWPGEAECAEDFEVSAWRWLKQSISSGATEIVLGYGDDDRFASTYGPLIEALSPERVYVVPGAHDWTTWTTLWARIGEDDRLPQGRR